MRRRAFAFPFLMAALGAAQALADPAFDLWTKGSYQEAIKQGLAENTPEGLSAAARAAVSDMTLHATPCMACITRAEELSRKAIAADPKGALPAIYLTAALGYRGRLIGMMAAERAKLADQSRAALDAALAAHPDNAQLIATLGGWHFEVVRSAGAMLARWTHGATVDRGIEKYEQALKLAPDDPVINFQFGLGLAAIDAEEYHDRIEAAWKRVVAAAPQNAYEVAQKKRAAELLTLLDGGEKKTFVAKLDSFTGVPS